MYSREDREANDLGHEQGVLSLSCLVLSCLVKVPVWFLVLTSFDIILQVSLFRIVWLFSSLSSVLLFHLRLQTKHNGISNGESCFAGRSAQRSEFVLRFVCCRMYCAATASVADTASGAEGNRSCQGRLNPCYVSWRASSQCLWVEKWLRLSLRFLMRPWEKQVACVGPDFLFISPRKTWFLL